MAGIRTHRKGLEMNEKIKSAKHFGLHKNLLRCAALRLALGEMQCLPHAQDMAKIRRILERFKLHDAFAFYATKPELFGIR